MRCLFVLFILLISSSGFSQNPRVIITDSEVDLIPEGIAIDNKTGKIYISSINRHKIITIDQKGNHKDFIKPGQDGFMEGLGIKVDDKRGWVWATSVSNKGKIFYSNVHAFDLRNGKTMQQYSIKDTLPHLFNDLAITSDGNFIITDTYFSALYKITPANKTLELFSKDSLLLYPNGLAFGNNHLYVATYGKGLIRMDTATKKYGKVTGVTDSLIAQGLDGLLFLKNKLIGVYNTGADSSKNCIVEYTLAKDGKHIINERLLGKGHSLLADPTTAALYKNDLYVLANSHLDVFNKNKMSTKGIEQKLRPVSLLIYKME